MLKYVAIKHYEHRATWKNAHEVLSSKDRLLQLIKNLWWCFEIRIWIPCFPTAFHPMALASIDDIYLAHLLHQGSLLCFQLAFTNFFWVAIWNFKKCNVLWFNTAIVLFDVQIVQNEASRSPIKLNLWPYKKLPPWFLFFCFFVFFFF